MNWREMVISLFIGIVLGLLLWFVPRPSTAREDAGAARPLDAQSPDSAPLRLSGEPLRIVLPDIPDATLLPDYRYLPERGTYISDQSGRRHVVLAIRIGDEEWNYTSAELKRALGQRNRRAAVLALLAAAEPRLGAEPRHIDLPDIPDTVSFTEIRQEHPEGPLTGDAVAVRHPVLIVEIGKKVWEFTSTDLERALGKPRGKK
jgi:hypothetical protein